MLTTPVCSVLAQNTLLTTGYLFRRNPKHVKGLSRTSLYLHAVSNRLAASLPRARFLGMVFGMAISRMIDSPDKIMSFDLDELVGDEAKSWFSLVDVDDQIGSIEELKGITTISASDSKRSITLETKAPKRLKQAPKPAVSQVISIEAIDDEMERDDDLDPYQKPDYDPSDSDEDPTLINRNKPTAPVYITDLINALNKTDKLDTIEIALQTAPSLIRRKANFGTELSENVSALASALLNLQDGMSNEALHHLRLSSLISCIVSQPAKMGPWFASTYFEGDFSLSQRASLLTTVGLSARALAGHKDDSNLSFPDPSLFPSQRLPTHLAVIYGSSSQIPTLSNQLTHSALQPMALEAADKLTGPNIVKVRTFSSRIALQKKTAIKQQDRSRRIPKDLHRLLAECFYLPLCCRMGLLLASHPDTTSSTLFENHILRLFLQTLTVILTTLGPHAVQVNVVTRETLILLVALHINSSLALDAAILPPILQLLFTILDINIQAGPVAEENLVTEFGTQVAELVTWAGTLGDVARIPVSEGEGDGMPWPVIAAGCQVKWHEVGRKFQGRMIGLGVGMDLDSF